MNKKLLLGLLLLISFFVNAQTIEDFYDEEDYEEVIKFEEQKDLLTGQELAFIGYAFFKLEMHQKAVEFYTHAINNGFETGNVFYLRGIAHRYINNFKESEEDLSEAMKVDSSNQSYVAQLGQTYYKQNRLEEAYALFSIARKLTFDTGLPYVMVPAMHEENKEFAIALKEYQISAELIDKQDDNYLFILERIGYYESLHYKNYEKALEAYEKIIAINPENDFVLSSIMSIHTALNNHEKANEIFKHLKQKYVDGTIDEQLLLMGAVQVDRFLWGGDKYVTTYKSFKEPEKEKDEIFKTFIFSLKENKVVKTYKTMQDEGENSFHLFCSICPKEGRKTYSCRWEDKEIKFHEYKEYLMMALNDNLDCDKIANK
ncbi:tetratricopeptide repeat protein [Aureivirga sp. CE67]|uniref:tetratricopeptide repeat protein n=1 Tax=Aureivirga sp. CE67 TaxID=1788983 RepID=UPI0018CB2A93|nr:hypothetical protein [Aureivirga sp. CE67]